MSKKTNDMLRAQYGANVAEMLAAAGYDVLKVGAAEYAIPCVDADGEDNYVVVKVSVPTGSRDGDIYDGYAMAEDYEMKMKEKAAKAEKAAKDKAAKIARDQKMREQKAAAKAAREAK